MYSKNINMLVASYQITNPLCEEATYITIPSFSYLTFVLRHSGNDVSTDLLRKRPEASISRQNLEKFVNVIRSTYFVTKLQYQRQITICH